MTPDEAAWVRVNAWTKAIRRLKPGVGLCACQWGPTTHCLNGEHEKCRRGTASAARETVISDRQGLITHLAEPYAHPTVAGEPPLCLAQVWLADRICKWACPCDCGHPAERKREQRCGPGPRYELVPLPGLELVGAAS